jgi:transposase-like protein
VGFPS